MLVLIQQVVLCLVQHAGLWEETSMLDQAKDTTRLLIKEDLNIHLTDFKPINRDEGIAILECWQPVLNHATMTSSTHTTPHQETDDGTTENHEYKPTERIPERVPDMH